MSEPASGEFSSDPGFTADPPTPEQAALLQYLGFTAVESITQPQAGVLISRSEADPAGREKLAVWEREKYRLHPGLFAPPQRSFREARWWQTRVSDETLHCYSFQQPSLDQTFVILEALDRREPGWDREGGKRREARFMNELATLSPELCKPGCVFPHELPEDSSGETPAAPSPATLAPAAFVAPSAPYVPSQYAASVPSFDSPGQPAWQPPVQPPAPMLLPTGELRGARAGNGGAWKWALLAVLLVAGAGAGLFFLFRSPTLERGGRNGASTGGPPSKAAYAPVAANESRQRAIAKYPDLTKAGTVMNAKFVVAYRELNAAHDPLLQQPDWPERLAARCAAAMSPSPSPAGSKNPGPPASSPPAVKPSTAASAPAAANFPQTTPASSVTAPPVESMFVSLEASYKDKLNAVKYRQHGAAQEAGVAVDVRSMMHNNARFVLRCVFFKRPNGRGDLRSVLSSSEKRFELAAGQTYSDAFDSPPVYRGRGATEEFDGWLVQLIPEGSDHFLKQIGSTGTIEEWGKRTKF